MVTLVHDMSDETDRAVRFQNYAEELRVIAAGGSTAESRDALLRVAAEYDRMAESLEAINKSKIATGQRPRPRPTG